MKLVIPMLLVLLSACSSPSDPTSKSQSEPSPSEAAAPTASVPATAAATVSATGTVEAVDVGAGTVTLAHGAIDVLQWPAMTMAFKAPNVDLAALRKGDHVAFELVAQKDGYAITKITKQ